MPLAKSAPVTNPEPVVPAEVKPPAQQVVSPQSWDGIPFEIYRFFDLKIPIAESKDVEKIKEIYSWASDESGSVGDAMLRINELERKLGAPHIGESRLSKLWNWIALDLYQRELQKQKEAYIRRQE